jgi:glycosyltransferase 2 family protein
MKRFLMTWGRVVGSLLTLGILVWRLGTGPFLNGLRTVDGGALAIGVAVAVLTTICCAWRWKTVAGGLGIRVSLPAAVAAYYRSQFLNITLPGGVVGDVHRGVSHGREVSDVGRAMRAVVLERFAGQVVQLVVTVVVLLALSSPVQSAMPLVAAAGLAVVLGIGFFARRRPRIRRAVTGDIALPPKAWLGVALSSALVVGGHAITFLVAARTAGASASVSQLLPLALLAMMAMVLPSAGGWGPREGVTAWAFGAAGLGAGRGVATGVVYGVMVLFASLPGAAVLIVAWFKRNRLPRRSLRDRAAHA